ncbi:MAG: single-stranded DNA-binding protein [Bacilli bacterium]|nr:single-stranded DNA-binding protein [Bacilli bacterium]
MMNKVMLVGRLTAKPELRYTGSNTAFLRFTVAVNRPFANAEGKREADFINVVAWRKQAETIAKFFDKGNLIGIEGRLQTGSYDDQNGNKRYTTDVQLDNFEFVEGKKDAQASIDSDSPYNYQDEGVSVQDDPFAEYGDSVSIDDSFLD